MEKQWKQWQPLFFWAPKLLQMVVALMKLKDAYSLEENDQPRRILKSRDITLPTKAHLVKAMVFPVVMYGCGSWTIMKAESRKIDAFELWCWRRLLRVPWSVRRSNLSILKESVLNIGMTDAETQTPILRPAFVKNPLIGKYYDSGKDWSWEEKGTTQNEMVERHKQHHGHDFQ